MTPQGPPASPRQANAHRPAPRRRGHGPRAGGRGAVGARSRRGPRPTGAARLDARPQASAGPQTRRRPTSPPARICGSRGLRGPTQRPTGFRAVSPSQRLDIAGGRGSAWHHGSGCRKGTHLLGGGDYDQVQPKSDMVFMGAPGAVLDGQKENRYAFTGQASDVTIEHLTIQNFGTRLENRDEGVVNHDQGDGWKIRHNTVRWNGGAGVFIGDGNTVAAQLPPGQRSVRLQCLRTGRSAATSTPPRTTRSRGNNTADWDRRFRPVAAAPEGGSSGRPRNADVTDNWVHDNHGVGLWADTNNTGFLVSHNLHRRQRRRGNVLRDQLQRGDLVQHVRRATGSWPVRNERGFPTPALYISETRQRPARRSGVRHDLPDRRQPLHGQLGRHHCLGERRPLLRLAGQHQLRAPRPW